MKNILFIVISFLFIQSNNAQQSSIAFFDEVDALGAKRSDMRQSAGKNVINQFLAEMDGIEADNDGLLIIGATVLQLPAVL